MRSVYIAAARRTPVAPRGGALHRLEAWQLGAEVIAAVLDDAGIEPGRVDGVIMGNALYGGGNPARLAALAANIPERVPALSIDTQCCSGLDAVAQAASRIAAGQADIIVAGGLESYSRAPIRQRRPLNPGEVPESYDRPPFSPWPDRDPDMLESAAALAVHLRIDRGRQESYAVESHRRAMADSALGYELAVLQELGSDSFTRALSMEKCARLPVIAGADSYGLTAATTAVEADAAAALVVVSPKVMSELTDSNEGVRIAGASSVGGDPEMPALAPIRAIETVLASCGMTASDLDYAEVMEAFAVQAIACIEGAGLAAERVNRRGGALARGHPVGASGAILAVRLWHDLVRAGKPARGLAAIAAAGGLGSAMILETGPEH